MIGLAVGLLVGLGAAFTVESLDDAIRSKDDLEHAAPNVPVMALVPMIGSWRDRAKPFLVTMTEPTSPAAEAYRSLRTSLQFAAYRQSDRVRVGHEPDRHRGQDFHRLEPRSRPGHGGPAGGPRLGRPSSPSTGEPSSGSTRASV